MGSGRLQILGSEQGCPRSHMRTHRLVMDNLGILSPRQPLQGTLKVLRTQDEIILDHMVQRTEMPICHVQERPGPTFPAVLRLPAACFVGTDSELSSGSTAVSPTPQVNNLRNQGAGDRGAYPPLNSLNLCCKGDHLWGGLLCQGELSRLSPPMTKVKTGSCT